MTDSDKQDRDPDRRMICSVKHERHHDVLRPAEEAGHLALLESTPDGDFKVVWGGEVSSEARRVSYLTSIVHSDGDTHTDAYDDLNFTADEQAAHEDVEEYMRQRKILAAIEAEKLSAARNKPTTQVLLKLRAQLRWPAALMRAGRSDLLIPPGSGLQAALPILFGRKKAKSLFEPLLGEMQHEWVEAHANGAGRFELLMVRARGYGALAVAATSTWLGWLLGLVVKAWRSG